MESRNFLVLAALFGFLGVAIGAFGAHGLTAHFAAHPDLEDTFRTAVQYQLYHALALIGAAWAAEREAKGSFAAGRWSRWAGSLFVIGIILFSGSLYILSLFDLRIIGAVAPLGGLALLGGWLCLGLAAWRSSAKG